MKPFHYNQDPLYAVASAILADQTVKEDVPLEEGVEDIAAAVEALKKGDKTNFGVVVDVGQHSISFKAKDLPITKIAFNQRKMGSKDFVLDKLVKLKEDVSLDEADVSWDNTDSMLPKNVIEEGVGDYSVRKTGSSVSKGEEDYEQDVTTTTYDILKGGKIIGNLSTNDFMGGVYGKMYGKDLPDLEGYGSYTTSGVLGNLHKFLKSNTGMKWMAKNANKIDEAVKANDPANLRSIISNHTNLLNKATDSKAKEFHRVAIANAKEKLKSLGEDVELEEAFVSAAEKNILDSIIKDLNNSQELLSTRTTLVKRIIDEMGGTPEDKKVFEIVYDKIDSVIDTLDKIKKQIS